MISQPISCASESNRPTNSIVLSQFEVEEGAEAPVEVRLHSKGIWFGTCYVEHFPALDL